MFDTLSIILPKDKAPGTDFLEQIPQHLTSVTSTGRNQQGNYITGFIDSLKVSITDSRIKVSDSFCKYYLASNLKTLSRGDTRRAIQKLSDSIHLDMNRANVTRLDVAKNLIMKHDPGIYFPHLGELQYYKRLSQNAGLYYHNGKRQLVFYNKIKEQQAKRKPIPELYQHRHVLRIELRFLRQMKKQFNQFEVTAGHLHEEKFYFELVARWKNEYQQIQKVNSKLQKMKPTTSSKDFIQALATMAIMDLGQPALLNIIQQWQETGELTRKQAYDLRSKIKEISKATTKEQKNDLIQELDKKVKEASRFG
jgi:hypothetical protein